MRKTIAIVLLASLASFFALDVCAKRKKIVKANGGVSVAPYGISIDASYDKRLDTLVPGYKVINAVVVNGSFNVISLDPKRDKWSIRFAGRRGEVPVINNLRSQEPKVWRALPEKVREMIGYPLVVPIGAEQVIDLFVPEKYDVGDFNELRAYIGPFHTRFDILVSQ